MLDLDDERAVEVFKKMRPHIERSYAFEKVECWNSRNGRLHVKVTLRGAGLNWRHRLMLQALLGSDPLRGYLTKLRMEQHGDVPHNNVLFKPKGAEVRELGLLPVCRSTTPWSSIRSGSATAADVWRRVWCARSERAASCVRS